MSLTDVNAPASSFLRPGDDDKLMGGVVDAPVPYSLASSLYCKHGVSLMFKKAMNVCAVLRVLRDQRLLIVYLSPP